VESQFGTDAQPRVLLTGGTGYVGGRLLHALLERGAHGSTVFEIGGAEVATYGELMREYARQRGLRRLLIPVPVLTRDCRAYGSGS
jgi:uncharacterized protein YbjT (DUF2867 family)